MSAARDAIIDQLDRYGETVRESDLAALVGDEFDIEVLYELAAEGVVEPCWRLAQKRLAAGEETEAGGGAPSMTEDPPATAPPQPPRPSARRHAHSLRSRAQGRAERLG